jgi:hypothetical protein
MPGPARREKDADLLEVCECLDLKDVILVAHSVNAMMR